MTDPGRLTVYQAELLETVGKGDPVGQPGDPIDFDQLLDSLSWNPTKASAHFSIRALVRRNLLLKLPELRLRRGRMRVCFQLTDAGKAALDPRLELNNPLPGDSALSL